MQAKDYLLEIYQLTLNNGWYWQKKENMSPWKVFSENHFKTKPLLWLLFRVHKLCKAKYAYFSTEFGDWQPVVFETDKISWPDLPTEKDWVTAEAFGYIESGRFITITKLHQIREKPVFIGLIEEITGRIFPGLEN
jgi:hypothetical protein